MKTGMTMKRKWLAFLLALWICAGVLSSCGGTDPTEEQTSGAESDTAKEQTEAGTDGAGESETEKEKEDMYAFDTTISEQVLRRYLSRAVTIAPEGSVYLSLDQLQIRDFIIKTGAKYICRSACCWNPGLYEYATYDKQKEFIQSVHRKDPDVVFEACIFECVSGSVNEIPIPKYVFEEFGLPYEQRCFDVDRMRFEDGFYRDQWGEGTCVPDITRKETQMFFFYRASAYIDVGFEGLHMGQVHLMGKNDEGWEHYTDLFARIRSYAKQHARRHMVLINAHTHGILDADGELMFDFHMWPSRPRTGELREDGVRTATLEKGYLDSVYGDSLGGTTKSGWKCAHLPVLVELDNFNDSYTPLEYTVNSFYVWGCDEITWFANQPDAYRAEFLRYAYERVHELDPDCYFAMPGQRVARYYDRNGKIYQYVYYGYRKSYYEKGNDDQLVVQDIWAKSELANS